VTTTPNPLPNPAVDQPTFTPEPGITRETAAWSVSDVLLLGATIFAVLVATTVVGISLAMALPAFDGMNPTEVGREPRVVIASQAVAYVFALLIMYMAVTRRYGSRFLDVLSWKWPRNSWLGYILTGTALGVTVLVLSRWLPLPRDVPIERFFRDPGDAYMMAAFATLLGPMMEELYFRGFLYPALARKTGTPIAVAFCALPFAVIHGPQVSWAWAALLVVFGVGVVFGAIRAATRSLAAAVLVHAGYNALLFFALYLGTDGFRRLERLTR
jgi:membrane protease YdiL (CAAX protease family)